MDKINRLFSRKDLMVFKIIFETFVSGCDDHELVEHFDMTPEDYEILKKKLDLI